MLNALPSSDDQFYAFVDERAIGLPISDLPTQINRVAKTAFESAAFYISGIGMATFEVPPEPDAQQAIVRALIANPEIAEGIYDWLAHEIGEHLKQPLVQPLTILDMADWEQFCSLLEAGHTAPDLLARKTGAHRRLDWQRLVHDDPALSSDARASAVKTRADIAFEHMLEDLSFDPALLKRVQSERPCP